MNFSFSTVVLALLYPLCSPAGIAKWDTPKNRFEGQIRQLDPKNDKEERLAALRWFQKNHQETGAVRAIPALERCLKEDKDADIRVQAVQALALIALHRKEPCPLIVTKALLDSDWGVSNMAGSCVGLFESYPPGTAGVLLKAMKLEDPRIRSDAATLLGHVGSKEKKVVDALRAALSDRHFGVRHNARIALFSLTANLEDIVPYCVQVREELRPPAARPGDTEEMKNEHVWMNMIRLGALMKLADLVQSHTDGTTKLLTAMLKDPSPATRRLTANTLGDIARIAHEYKKNPAPGSEEITKAFEHCPAVLHKARMDELLKELRDKDPDLLVRALAAQALRELDAALK